MGDEFNFSKRGPGASVPPLPPPQEGEQLNNLLFHLKNPGMKELKNKQLFSLHRQRKHAIVKARHPYNIYAKLYLTRLDLKKISNEVNICNYLD